MDKLKLIILQGNVNASHKQSISLRFKVHYFDKDPDGEEDHKVGEAEVIFSAPRHPNRGIKMQEPMTWKDALGVVDQDLEANYWGSGPEASCKRGQQTDILLLWVLWWKRLPGIFRRNMWGVPSAFYFESVLHSCNVCYLSQGGLSRMLGGASRLSSSMNNPLRH